MAKSRNTTPLRKLPTQIAPPLCPDLTFDADVALAFDADLLVARPLRK